MDWIKLDTDIFHNEKIMLIAGMKDADSMILLWIKLLALAGKKENDGVFTIGRMAYTNRMFADVLGVKPEIVDKAFELFESLDMIAIVDGVVTIPDWGSHQGSDAVEKNKAAHRDRQKRYRDKQRDAVNAVTGDVTRDVTRDAKNVTVTLAEEDLEEDLEKDKDILLSSSSACARNAGLRVMDAWPNLPQPAIEQLLSYMHDLPDEVIIYALEETQLKPGAGWKYMKAILDSCLDRNLLTLEAVKQAEAERKAQRKTQASTASKQGNKSKVDLNYQQHEYTDKDFGADFYYDPSRDFLPESGG